MWDPGVGWFAVIGNLAADAPHSAILFWVRVGANKQNDRSPKQSAELPIILYVALGYERSLRGAELQ